MVWVGFETIVASIIGFEPVAIIEIGVFGISIVGFVRISLAEIGVFGISIIVFGTISLVGMDAFGISITGFEKISNTGIGMVVESILRNFPNLNPNWLILGTGEIWINEFDNLNNQINVSKKNSGKKYMTSLESSNEKELLQKIISDKDSHIADLRRTIALLEKSLMKS